jgi:sigma-B regulation protein RsbU (phosphoserine phosphatase)
LPSDGWLLACGSSVASRQVGGDYFDVAQVNPRCWSAVVADVSGKGVSSALLASLLQGALLATSGDPQGLSRRMARLNRFLLDRTGGEKYATAFYCLLDDAGALSYINAAHCPPLLVRRGGAVETLDATSAPVGLLDGTEFALGACRLASGDKLLIHSDGVTDAQNAAGGFYGRKRLRQAVAALAGASCDALHGAIQESISAFTEGAPQSDDITLLVLEYRAA